MFSQTKSIVAVVVAVFSLASALPANANEIVKHTIPASLCEPASTWYGDQSLLTEGVYIFSGNNTGAVRLNCPLPLGPQAGSLGRNNDIRGFRVYYRDSNGTASGSTVFVRLMARRADGSKYWGPWWTSNDYTTTGFNVEYKIAATELDSDSLYYFYVYLYRSSTRYHTTFSGIDFVTSVF